MPLGRRLYFLGRFLEGAGAGAVAVTTFLSGYPHIGQDSALSDTSWVHSGHLINMAFHPFLKNGRKNAREAKFLVKLRRRNLHSPRDDGTIFSCL